MSEVSEPLIDVDDPLGNNNDFQNASAPPNNNIIHPLSPNNNINNVNNGPGFDPGYEVEGRPWWMHLNMEMNIPNAPPIDQLPEPGAFVPGAITNSSENYNSVGTTPPSKNKKILKIPFTVNYHTKVHTKIFSE